LNTLDDPAAAVVEIQTRERVLTTQEGTTHTHTAAHAVIPGGVLKGDESGAGAVMIGLLANVGLRGMLTAL